ncbi:MAG: PqqD family protein [Gemmatimonadales bacterium]
MEKSERPPFQFIVSSDVLAEPIGSEMVLVNLGTDRMYELNHSACRVWQLLSDGFGREAIVMQITREFEVDEAQFSAELERFVAELVQDGIIHSPGL